MEQQNNTGALNDTAGVLPMDTGVTVNGNHDEGENNPSSSSKNTGAKKGRGRPPKSAGSTKVSNNSNTEKRARGRPAKTGETTPAIKTVAAPIKVKEVASTNDDAGIKKRGRPSKTSTPPVEKVNGISKRQVQLDKVPNYQEEPDDEPAKKKRGRPSGLVPKKAVVTTTPSAPKEGSSTKKRGRPSGSAGAKKPASKPKVAASNDGSAKKRGRPKKAAGSPTPVATTSVNETTATVTPNNIQ